MARALFARAAAERYIALRMCGKSRRADVVAALLVAMGAVACSGKSEAVSQTSVDRGWTGADGGTAPDDAGAAPPDAESVEDAAGTIAITVTAGTCGNSGVVGTTTSQAPGGRTMPLFCGNNSTCTLRVPRDWGFTVQCEQPSAAYGQSTYSATPEGRFTPDSVHSHLRRERGSDVPRRLLHRARRRRGVDHHTHVIETQ